MPTPSEQLLSRTIYDTDGTTTIWDFSFESGYLDPSHVKAYTTDAGGARTDHSLTLIGEFQAQITPALPDNLVLTIYRDTPKNAPLVNFMDESGFSEIALDTNAKQAVMVAAEAIDTINTSDLGAAIAAADQAALAAAAASSSASSAAASVASTGTAVADAEAAADAAIAAAASINPLDFATAAQGVKADSALQPAAIGTTVPALAETVTKTSAVGAANIPAGTTAERPTPSFGMQRANSSTGAMEWWNGTIWAPLGGAAPGANADITSLGGLTSAIKEVRQLQPITAAIASNAITITPSALSLEFRNTTLTNGAVSFVKGTPAALVIAASDSFGLVTAAGNQRIAILAINNAGTIELAASALAGGVSLDETGVITTATAATLGTHIKAANVHTGVAYRVIGFVDATFTTATGWGSLALVQGAGGQALAAMSSLGYGQTLSSTNLYGAGRAYSTTYYNTTGKPITVSIGCSNTNAIVMSYFIGASQFTIPGTSAASNLFFSFNVPVGSSYSVVATASAPTTNEWRELR